MATIFYHEGITTKSYPKNTHWWVGYFMNEPLHLYRFFIGYWILKRGWIFILAPFFILPVVSSLPAGLFHLF